MPRYRLAVRKHQRDVDAQLRRERQPSYRQLQELAKQRGIPANQTADALRAAIAEDERNG